jgi:hypothetical protein
VDLLAETYPRQGPQISLDRVVHQKVWYTKIPSVKVSRPKFPFF